MHVYSFQRGQEAGLIKYFLGYTLEEMLQGKGEFDLLQGDIFSLTVNYQFSIKKKYFIAPKLGINLISSKLVAVGLDSMSFNNEGKTIGGKLGYDIRMSKHLGWNFGFEIGYKLNKAFNFYIDLEDIRDIKGIGSNYAEGFNFYEAKNLGIGIKYFFYKK